MGCRCRAGQKASIKTKTVTPKRASITRTRSTSQLQALAQKASDQADKPVSEFEKRRAEKLRREAIRRSLGKN